MSKKKLNKKGQQYKKQMQHTKNVAPRIDASKSIYEVDAKVQAYSAGECAEEADVALGVVTGDTEIVNPVTEEVVDVDPVPVEEIEEEEEYDTEDSEDDNDDLDEDEMCDDEVDEYDEEDADDEEEFVEERPKHRAHRRNMPAASYKHAMHCADIIDCANNNPNIVNTASYGERIVRAIHKAKEIVDANDEMLVKSMRSKKMASILGPCDEVTFRTEFLNWCGTGYTYSSAVMDALETQYNDFMKHEVVALNDPDVPNVYYSCDLKTITSGMFMHTGVGMMPVSGRYANVSIYVPREKLSEFIENYTTRVCFCQTSDKIPPHILALAAEGLAPVDGIRAYYLINMPKFLKLFAKDRDRYITLYDSDEGYSMSVSNYDRANPRDVKCTAMPYKSSLSIGLMKAAFY